MFPGAVPSASVAFITAILEPKKGEKIGVIHDPAILTYFTGS